MKHFLQYLPRWGIPYLQTWIGWAIDWVDAHETLLTVLTLVSVVVFVASLLIIPWLILQLPSDYFNSLDSEPYHPLERHPAVRTLVSISRNVIGLCLIGIGIVLLVLPGQGLLTIIVGIILTRFPGKRQLIYWLVARKSVHNSLNWIRRQADKPEFELQILFKS